MSVMENTVLALAAPKKPTVVSSTRDSVTLAWEAAPTKPNSSRPHYTLQIKHRVHGWLTVYWGYHTRQEIKDLGPGECYQFRLRVTTTEGETLWSLKVAASTKEEQVSIVNLHRAVQHGKPQAVRKILASRQGAVDVLSRAGVSPLMQAASKGDAYLVGLMLSAGADVNLGGAGSGRTALMLACHEGHVDIARQLVEKGARWDVQDRSGCTALHYAVDGSQLEAVMFAIEDGADIEAQDCQKWTPLMRGVVLESAVPILQGLIAHGASVNALDSRGQTSLMQAVLSGRVEVVKLLVEAGADRTPCNDYHNTALDMARAREMKDIIRLLASHKGDAKEEKRGKCA